MRGRSFEHGLGNLVSTNHWRGGGPVFGHPNPANRAAEPQPSQSRSPCLTRTFSPGLREGHPRQAICLCTWISAFHLPCLSPPFPPFPPFPPDFIQPPLTCGIIHSNLKFTAEKDAKKTPKLSPQVRSTPHRLTLFFSGPSSASSSLSSAYCVTGCVVFHADVNFGSLFATSAYFKSASRGSS